MGRTLFSCWLQILVLLFSFSGSASLVREFGVGVCYHFVFGVWLDWWMLFFKFYRGLSAKMQLALFLVPPLLSLFLLFSFPICLDAIAILLCGHEGEGLHS